MLIVRAVHHISSAPGLTQPNPSCLSFVFFSSIFFFLLAVFPVFLYVCRHLDNNVSQLEILLDVVYHRAAFI